MIKTQILIFCVLSLTAVSAWAETLDRSCQNASDCIVTNIFSCCGAQPVCANKNNPPPEGVDWNACDPLTGVCGFESIESCTCESGKCVPDKKAQP